MEDVVLRPEELLFPSIAGVAVMTVDGKRDGAGRGSQRSVRFGLSGLPELVESGS
ncbi:hypothetical protein ACIOTI_31495 [Streptomyces sp. NPDC087843]|uniref:hypothetical protein n=1 Tax=Streptomyces sp. NPDC087843 TaxID=3365804 RepID=UPI003824A1A7